MTTTSTSITTTGLTLDEYLSMRASERQSKYKTILVDNFPPLNRMNERIYWGVLSWTLPARKERWIKPGAMVNVGHGIQTGSEVARDYLDYYHPARLRATGRQAQAITMHRSAPIYCTPTVKDEMSYVDVSSAFWSIMSIVGWDVDYFPGKWIVKGRPPLDFPLADHKVARTSLVMCGLPTPMRVWTGEKMVSQRRNNPHINLGLWSIIMDTLHALGAQAVRLGAIYVHTDGYILPRESEGEMMEIIRSYQLECKVKARGLAVVLGMGNWRIGERKTKMYGLARSHYGQVNEIYRVNGERIRAKLTKISVNERKRMTSHGMSLVVF